MRTVRSWERCSARSRRPRPRGCDGCCTTPPVRQCSKTRLRAAQKLERRCSPPAGTAAPAGAAHRQGGAPRRSPVHPGGPRRRPQRHPRAHPPRSSLRWSAPDAEKMTALWSIQAQSSAPRGGLLGLAARAAYSAAFAPSLHHQTTAARCSPVPHIVVPSCTPLLGVRARGRNVAAHRQESKTRATARSAMWSPPALQRYARSVSVPAGRAKSISRCAAGPLLYPAACPRSASHSGAGACLWRCAFWTVLRTVVLHCRNPPNTLGRNECRSL